MRDALKTLTRALLLGLAVAVALPGCMSGTTTGGGTPSTEKDADPGKDEKDKKDKDSSKPPPVDPG